MSLDAPKVPPAVGLPPLPANVVADIHWPGVFEFTHLFRGFRLAMNPTKLVIALLAILAIYTTGRLFDVLWGPRVYKDEIESFRDLPSAPYRQQRAERRDGRRGELEDLLQKAAADASLNLDTETIRGLCTAPRAAERVLRQAYIRQFQADTVGATIAQRSDDAARLQRRMLVLHDTVGHGIFDSLMDYEIRQFDALIENTLTFVRVSPIHGPANPGGDENQAISGGLFSKNPARLFRSDTMVGCLVNMTITAPYWLVAGTEPIQWTPAADAGPWQGWADVWLLHRIPYLLSVLLLLAFWLVVAAVSGGLICRISALEFSGSQNLHLGEIWSFVRTRLPALVAAPLLPLLIIAVLGGILTLLGLAGAIPWLGEILVGMFLIVSLVGAFVMMLVLLGVIGGFNLMYPTIAVEGSDAFDACSRSWAYVYGAPWRLALYSVIALIYGIITLLFVSFAAYLVLALTHTFVGLGTNFFGLVHGQYNGLLKLDTLWPAPRINELSQPINWWAMNWSEWTGSVFLHCWVFTVICFIGAYVMSFHYSIHTVLYFLLRRAVEGQSLSEVHREEPPTAAPVPNAAPNAPAEADASTPPAAASEGACSK